MKPRENHRDFGGARYGRRADRSGRWCLFALARSRHASLRVPVSPSSCRYQTITGKGLRKMQTSRFALQMWAAAEHTSVRRATALAFWVVPRAGRGLEDDWAGKKNATPA